MIADNYSFSDSIYSPKNKNICLDTNFIYSIRVQPHDTRSEEYQIYDESDKFYEELKKNGNKLYISIFSIEEALHLLYKHYLILFIHEKLKLPYKAAEKIWHDYYKFKPNEMPENYIEPRLSGFIGWLSKEGIQPIYATNANVPKGASGSPVVIDVLTALPKIIAKYKILSTDACILAYANAFNISTFVSNDADFLRYEDMNILGYPERKGKITVYMPTILYNRRAGIA